MRLSSSTLFLVVLCVGAVAGTTASYDGYTWTATNGAFVVSSVEFSSRWGLPWGPGNVVDIVIRGTSNKIITAGTTKFNLWEDEVPKFEDNGFAPYFVCNNKGCDPSDPESLHLEDPTVEPTAFAVAVSFTMTRAQKTGMFSMDIWGVDQDHSPYDFSVSIDYNYTYGADSALPLPMPAATTPPALRGSAAPAPQVLPLPIDYNVTSGAFAVTGVSASAPDGRWTPGETATVTVRGEILDKHILAGTAKFKLYEFGITHFVASGNSPYFHCTNKGCDPSEPIALRLQNPNGLPTSFTLDVTFVVPNTQPGGTNTFLMDLWGVDQDHYPYDFDSSIRFHTSV